MPLRDLHDNRLPQVRQTTHFLSSPSEDDSSVTVKYFQTVAVFLRGRLEEPLVVAESVLFGEGHDCSCSTGVAAVACK